MEYIANDMINHRAMQCLPELPDFQLSLRPEEYELPEIEGADTNSAAGNQTHLLKEHLDYSSEHHDDDDDE